MLMYYNFFEKKKTSEPFHKECKVSEAELGNQLAVDSEGQSAKRSSTVFL